MTSVTLVVLLSGCAGATEEASEPDTTPTATADAFLAGHGLAGKDAATIVDELDRLPVAERPTDLMASVKPDQLVLTGDEGEVSLPMPEDEFYLSVAPYVEQTHECFHHSLTTCKGELGGKRMQVTLVDESGETVLDQTRTTFDNGFVGLWLPEGTEGTLTVTYDGKQGSVDVATTPDDPTCLTTLQLV